MKNTQTAKTLTAGLPLDAQSLFTFIADLENLSRWHTSFCRSLRKENGAWIAESPRGPVPVRLIRDDRSFVLDLLMEVAEGIELTHAIRVLSSGDGCEIVWTLVHAEGISDSVFNEQLRWAGSALHNLRKPLEELLPPRLGKEGVGVGTAPAVDVAPSPASSATRGEDRPELATEPLQAPSAAEVSSMPLSGKKLFIGNLSYMWTDTELRAHFAELGNVTTAEVARFRGRGGRSRGFGFVEMATETEAQTAIEKLHGGLAGGRQIIVRLAKSQENRPDRSRRATNMDSPDAQRVSGRAERMTRPKESNNTAGTDPSAESSAHPSAQEPPRRRPIPRSRSGQAPRRIPGRRPSSGPTRTYTEVDIVNKSGYEIFPRRAPGSAEPISSSYSAPPPSNIEASPYMDDTGDIENHGRRPPSHRRRR
jgi:RNA recognition motif-containing protein